MWDVSCAGHVSAGDTSHDTAVKELFEETGIKTKTSELEYITSIERKYFEGRIKDHEIYDVFLLKTEIDPAKLKFDPQEVEALKLMDAKSFFYSAKNDKTFIYNKKEYEIMEKLLIG
jgi:isopentenyldiphosphate isomerase